MGTPRIILALLIVLSCTIDTKAQSLIEARDAQLKKLATASDNEKVVIMATLAKDYVFQNPDSGLYYMKLALELARNITDEKVKASAYQAMGGGLLELGNLDSAAWYLLEAKRLHEEHKQPAEVVSDLNILTMVYRTARNFELSLNYGKSALVIHRSGIIPDSLKRDENSEAMTRNIIAWTYVKLGYADSAGLMMDTIRLKKYDKHFEWAFSRFILGDIANLKNQLPLALDEYRKGLHAAQLKGTHIDSIPCQIGIADVQLKQGNPDSAIYYAMQPIYRYRSGLFPEQFVRAYEILTDAYKKLGVSDSALKYTELMASEQDKLYGSDKSIQLIELAAREKDEKRKDQEARKTLISNVKIYSMLAGLFILAFIGTVLYRNNRSRKKSNHILRAKNKELEIESALEKVRSRSLAMYKSEELREVVQVIFEKVRELGFNFIDGAISILEFQEGSRNHVQWFAGPYYDYPRSFAVPYMEHAPSIDVINAHESRQEYFAKQYTREEKDSFFKELFEIGEYRNLPEEVKRLILDGEQYGISCAFASNSAILIHSNTGILLTPNEADILKRFARVFDQAYTRFLDLQNSEAHARETMIEAGLEKIRSRSLAMRSSEELKDVVAVVFEKLKEFGLTFDGAGIQLYTEGSKDSVLWVYSPEFVSVPTTINLPFVDDISLVNPIAADVLKARNSNEKVIRKTYSFEDKNDYFSNVVFKYNDLSKISQEARDMILKAPGQTAASVTETYSSIGIDRWGGSDFTEQDVETLKRAAKVFDQVYIRFRDLQKAEAQARESDIQLALERVRAKTMSLQHSSELMDAANIMFQQINALDIPVWTCGYNIWELEEDTCVGWMSTLFAIQPSFRIPLTENATFIHMRESRGKGEQFYSEEVSGEMLKEHYRYMLSLPDFRQIVSEHLDQDFSFPESQVNHVYNFKNGNLIFISARQLPEYHEVFLRFTAVFEQAYTRFLDLKKSEERAQAAMLEASMERVRAETASMRHAADLERINPMIWKELAMLGVPFIRCGVFIIEEGQELIHAFLSTPDGKAIASFQLPFEQTEMIEMVDHWRRKEYYMQHWDKTKFQNWMDSLIREGYLENDNNGIEVVENLYLHLFPFAQGLLYVGNVEALTEKNIKLAKNLSDAFSSAYTRYEDFVRLERAKQEVDTALTELKQAQSQLIQSEKMASLGELTAGIAHEIQNPLNFVNNFSEINIELADEITHAAEHGDLNQVKELSASIKSNQEKINAHGRRADAIVKSMLQHSRSNTGSNELTDINKLADEYLRLAYHGLRAKDKTFNALFEMDFDPALGVVQVVPQEMGRVLLNLFNNAFYAVNEKKKSAPNDYQPTVTVKTVRQNGVVELQVKDNGNGIPEKNIDKIFQPFFTTKPSGQGTGLGLSLGYDIIKAHGGELNVVSEDGVGSTFTIQIPA